MGARLIIIDKRCLPETVPLKGSATFGRFGATPSCDITAQSSVLGRRHGEFVYDGEEGRYYYIDNNSLNGTYINGYKLTSYNARGSKAFRLKDGDILKVDSPPGSVPHPEAVIMIFELGESDKPGWKTIDISRFCNITIGTDSNCVVSVDDRRVEEEHAVLRRNGASWLLFDNSTAGVELNGRRVFKNAAACDHSVIKVGGSLILLYGKRIVFSNPSAEHGRFSGRRTAQRQGSGFKAFMKRLAEKNR